MIRIRRKMFHEWDIDMQLKLTALTLNGDSGLSEKINYCSNELITWVAFEGGEPLGWGIQHDRADSSRKEAMFYVHPHHRRRGIGTKIVKRMRRDGYGAMWVHPWDRASRSFFTKVKQEEF